MVLEITDGEYEDCFIGNSAPTLLIPVHYYVENDFKTSAHISYDADRYYEITYYKMRFNNMLPIVYEKWIEINEKLSFGDEIIYYTSSNHFDKIAYYYYDYVEKYLRICFYNGIEFIDITYVGDKTPQEIIDTVDNICSEQ